MSGSEFFPKGRRGPTGDTGARGPQGPVGPGTVWRGGLRLEQPDAPETPVVYSPNDLVEFGGSTYLVRQEFEPAEDFYPESPDLPDWEDYFAVVAHRGDQGQKGNPGNTGGMGPTGPNGGPGPVGPSGIPGTYQEWLNRGNSGTYQNFLDAISGPQGIPGVPGTYEEWLERGNTGTYSDFLDAIRGHKGDQGNPGSPGTYEEARTLHGFTGTYQEFLEGLRGPKGYDSTVPGPQGYTPRKGIDYFDGDKGDTGSPGTYADWLLQPGNAGKSYADFQAAFKGPKGDTGLTGNPGTYQEWLDKGNSGTYSDFLNSIRGATGPQGVPGLAGTYAEWLTKPGNSGKSYAEFLAVIRGPQGFQGLPGKDGKQGEPGAAVFKGDQGPIGPIGLTGPVGERGLNWLGPWDPSYAYEAQDGVSYQGGSYICVADAPSTNQTPGASGDWEVLSAKGSVIGVKGPKGDKGDTGVQGATGLVWKGVWGGTVAYDLNDAVSYSGASYRRTAAGTSAATPDTDPANWALLAAKGDTGATGATGGTGPKGDKGDTGSAGSAGAAGLTWQGAWAAATAYVVNDAVSYQGASYRRLVAGTTATAPSADATNWAVLAAKGDTGATGAAGTNGTNGSDGAAGLLWTGAWNANSTYAVNNAVTYLGSSYRRKVFGSTPGTPAADTTNWELLASKGDAGATGATGATGTGYVPQGVWSGTTAYAVNDTVTYNGQTFRRTVAGTTPTNPEAETATTQRTLVYGGQGDTGGLIYYLGATLPGTTFTPPLPNVDSLTPTGPYLKAIISSRNNASALPYYAVDRQNINFNYTSANTAFQTFAFDLLTRSLAPTVLTLRHQATPATNSLINFVFEGSNDFNNWTPLVTVVNDAAVGASVWRSWNITGASSYRYLRVRSTGVDASGGNYLIIGEIELYGVLTEPALATPNWEVLAAKGATGATGPTGPTGATGPTGPAGIGHTIQDEGISLSARSKLNFVGSSVTASDDAANDTTTVTIAGGGGGSSETLITTTLPTSAVDGQTVLFQNAAMAAQGVMWRFRYNASSTSPNKWEFVGGPPYSVGVNDTSDSFLGTGAQNTTSLTYGDLSTVGPQITVPLTGDYQVQLATTAGAGSNGGGLMSIAVGSVAASDVDSLYISRSATGSAISGYRRLLKSFAGGTVLTAKYKSAVNAVTAAFYGRYMELLPVRVTGPTTQTLTYSSNGDTNGVIYYLGATLPGAAFTTPVSTADALTQSGNYLRVIASSRNTASTLGHLSVDRANSGGYASTNTAGQTIAYDLITRTLVPNYLTIRHQSTPDNNSLINFVFEGSNDGVTYTPLLTVTSAAAVLAGVWRAYPVSGSTAYRFLRIRSTGVDGSGLNYLVLGEVEFYGTLAST